MCIRWAWWGKLGGGGMHGAKEKWDTLMGAGDEVPKDTDMGIHASDEDTHAQVYGVGFIQNINLYPQIQWVKTAQAQTSIFNQQIQVEQGSKQQKITKNNIHLKHITPFMMKKG